MRDLIDSISEEYQRYRALGGAAIEQLTDEELSRAFEQHDNSIAALVWHVAGNLQSRFTDFRSSDGEKPWRDRDDEFVARTVTREELLRRWETGWMVVTAAVAALTDADLPATVTIRGQPLRIDQALHRSLAHTAYHVGQIVYIAKSFRGASWKCLSIPLGGSRAYNANPQHERPTAHSAMLKTEGTRPDPSTTVDRPPQAASAAHRRQ